MRSVARVSALCGFAALTRCSPVELPRTAYVAHPGKVRGAFSATYTVTHTHATYESPSASGTASGDGGNVSSFDSALASATWMALHEFDGALGIVPGCELGGGVRLLGLHAEARCQPVGYRSSSPFALALSAGGGTWLYGVGPYGRAGVDSTLSLGGPSLLLGVYARFGRRVHELARADVPPDPNYDPGHCCSIFPSSGATIQVEQTELRLSIPIGVAWIVGRQQATEYPARLVLGLVPSFVVYQANRSGECTDDCNPDVTITGYSEDLTLALTLRIEFDATD